MTVTIKRIEASQTLIYDTKDYFEDFEIDCLFKGIKPSNEAFFKFIEEFIAEDFGGSIPCYTAYHDDQAPTEAELISSYGKWGEHPVFTLSDWRAEVGNNETRLGYWEWTANCLEIHGNDSNTTAEEAP